MRKRVCNAAHEEKGVKEHLADGGSLTFDDVDHAADQEVADMFRPSRRRAIPNGSAMSANRSPATAIAGE